MRGGERRLSRKYGVFVSVGFVEYLLFIALV
jgi:hypothetical protein